MIHTKVHPFPMIDHFKAGFDEPPSRAGHVQRVATRVECSFLSLCKTGA
jgi:hypothetical protein